MDISPNDVFQVYSGKSGCMCGCLGEYRTTPRAVKAAITRMKKVDYKVHLWDNDDEAMGCIYYDNGSRNNVIYIRAGTGLSAEMIARADEDAK